MGKNCRTSNNSNEAGHISRLEVSGNWGNRHLSTQELSTLKPAVIAALCYEWTGKTTSLQWKNSSNRPCTFRALVFSINDSMRRESQKFYSRLAQMIFEKRDFPQSISINWIRTNVCFGLLKSSLLCLRGWEQHPEKQQNLKLTLMYLTLSPKYELDDDHKIIIHTFHFSSS